MFSDCPWCSINNACIYIFITFNVLVNHLPLFFGLIICPYVHFFPKECFFKNLSVLLNSFVHLLSYICIVYHVSTLIPEILYLFNHYHCFHNINFSNYNFLFNILCFWILFWCYFCFLWFYKNFYYPMIIFMIPCNYQ